MKRLISILLTVALMVTCMVSIVSAAGTGTVSVSGGSGKVGDTVVVTVKLDSCTGLAAYDAKLTYNASALKLVSMSAGALCTNVNANNGMAGWFSTTDATSGTLFTATFEILANSGNYNVGVQFTTVGDATCNAAGDAVALTVSSGTISVTHTHSATTEVKYDSTGHWNPCSSCDAKLNSADHSFGDWTIETNATCTTAGKKVRTCSCGYKAEAAIDATNHANTKKINEKTVSCVEDGYTGDTYCLDCKTTIATGEVIKAKGSHVDANGKWESDGTNHWHTCDCGAKFDEAKHSGGTATCKEAAKCSACGTAYGAKDSDNHVGGTEIKNVVAATCTKEGYTGDTCCKSCGVTLEDGEKTEKAEHKWDNGVVTKNATCAETGVTTYTCQTCKTETKTESIPVSDKHVVNRASDNKDGTHTAKCACGTVSATDEHKYTQSGKIIVAATTTKEGKQEMLCECGVKTTKTLPKLTSADAELDDVPPTGDITMQITLGAVAMVSMVAAAAFVFKRKIAK